MEEVGDFTRIEVINYLRDDPRKQVLSLDEDIRADVSIDIQDDGETLKVFVQNQNKALGS